MQGATVALIAICVPNGVFTVCQVCLEAVNRKNPRLAELETRVAELEAAFGKWHCPNCGDTGFLDGIGDSCDVCPVGWNAELRAALIHIEETARAALAADKLRSTVG